MPERTIHLVRHGQTERSSSRQSRLGNGLTLLGRQQAELTVRRLSALPISTIYHSTLLRAKETAEIIAGSLPGVPVRSSATLRERIPYLPAAFAEWYVGLSLEGLKRPDLEVPVEMSLWFGMWPRGTAWKAMEKDVAQAERAFERHFRKARGSDRHDIIVCHGNIIRYFVCRALQAPPESWVNTDINNCGISEIAIKPDGRIMLISHNDTGHLPYDMKTYV
jgi:serine/threonine-protein phosphatase PGAM5